MRRILACIGASLALVACTGGGSSRVVALYGGEANWAVIESPERTTAYRVMPPGRVKYIRAPDVIDGFEITEGPIPVDAATAGDLASILEELS